ncbi:DUF3638 domain-containing protein, partial [Legionella drancourtii]|uniref:DUF3638 domain-containing protein n=1 Tax=Legionella drancourtii TaxID=168933 RepID=UPI00058B4570
MVMDASLFAHIHNDAFLSGTYKLQGNLFKNTIAYLNQYCNYLSNNGTSIPAAYRKLMHNLLYLQQVEEGMEGVVVDAETKPLAAKICDDLRQMKSPDNILIPGGWHNRNGGHAMVYQFSLDTDGYLFTVFNAGAGLDYHAKRSIQDKELYNPRKTWFIPIPKTEKEQAELEHFISRLLQARVPASDNNAKKGVNADVLYTEIFSSISYINGTEINADERFPEYAYTGGQLLGTCSQRSIHQMLKINSDTLDTYQHFIFKFKLYSLHEYTQLCLDGTQPFNEAVADQIYLAIDNSLKILNIPGLFTQNELRLHAHALMQIKKSIAQALRSDVKKTTNEAAEIVYTLTLTGNSLAGPIIDVEEGVAVSQKPDIIDAYTTVGLLERLRLTITAIQKQDDSAIKYVYLERLILSLPLTNHGRFDLMAYHALQCMEDYQAFLKHLNSIQNLLTNLRNKWLQTAQIPLFNHLSLSILSLQADAYEAISALSRKEAMKTGDVGLPSFVKFTDGMMTALIAKRERDPFDATNNAHADQRIRFLKERFNTIKFIDSHASLIYYQEILKTEPILNAELVKLYDVSYGFDTSTEHNAIRQYEAESLYMIFLHLKNCGKNEIVLHEKFNPIIDKIQAHYVQESIFRQAINPYFKLKRATDKPLTVTDDGAIVSPLGISHWGYEEPENMRRDKYNLKDSPAHDALVVDAFRLCAFLRIYRQPQTANAIQLKSSENSKQAQEAQRITTEDIIARDYRHLRGNPSLQIALTLDYFTVHISQLNDENNQRYVEANLFQPGLLSNALVHQEFIPQFDNFINTGKRFFTQNGQHSCESLLFFRLDFLVSRYYAQLNPNAGGTRLQNVHEDLVRQFSLSCDPKVSYMLQQYLFLASVARIEAEEVSSKLFAQAMTSYFYIMHHANPSILEDTAHRIEIERAIGIFNIFATQQPETCVKEGVSKALLALGVSLTHGLTGTFPLYIVPRDKRVPLEVHVLKGIVLEAAFITAGVPLAIKYHPLIKQLDLHHEDVCRINPEQTYLILQCKEGETHLFYKENMLIVQKDWIIDGKSARYELQALTLKHEAYHANPATNPIKTDLPDILIDGTMNYWKNITASAEENGILVCDNVPVYAINGKQIKLLNEKGYTTPYQVSTLMANDRELFSAFESNRFIVTYEDNENTFITLPRFGLHFKRDKNTQTVIHEVTEERVIPTVSPIHSSVASLVLQGKGQHRVLVPIARFYDTKEGTPSDFYPVIHDKKGMIAENLLQKRWQEQPPVKEPLWDYKDSAHYASFQLFNGEPIADVAADALYLAYTYLVTNQPDKAWKILEDCNKRLGGLKGESAEVQYIKWICQDLPYLMSDCDNAVRNTPPFVACQLKAISLLTDYLLQDHQFDFQSPVAFKYSANTEYAQLELQRIRAFLQLLPETIYNTFDRFQRMGRHLEHQYQLSKIERKRLLDYYHQSLPKDFKPLGALGYQWTRLSIESLLEEQKVLIVQQQIGVLSSAEKKRIAHIETQLKRLNAVVSVSTALELVAIDLSLPARFKIKKTALKRIPVYLVDKKLKKKTETLSKAEYQRAIDLLWSTVNDDDFIEHFPVYLQIVTSSINEFSKSVLDFCTHTLLAKRHVPVVKQNSNIPFLCNVLYRAAHNRKRLIAEKYEQFEALVHIVRKYEVPPLKVYQARDIYSKMLATPEQIIAGYEHQVYIPLSTLALGSQPLIVQMHIEGLFDSNFKKEKTLCDELLISYQTIQNDLEKELYKLGKTPTNELAEEFFLEEQAGKALIVAEKQRKELATRFVEKPTLVRALHESANKAVAQLKSEMDGLWTEALQLANQGPDDSALAQIWVIEKESKTRAILTRADLLSLYTQANLAYSVAKTGLSSENAQKLHAMIHRALVQGICQQSAEKIKEQLHKARAGADLSSAVMALDLLARTEIPALDRPAIVLLQHEERILLHNRQVSALNALLASSDTHLGFNEVIEKIIMGGGKSKVILPILAETKAQGGNLVIVEVPPALLETNHEDLNRCSQRLYGKRAYRFDFNRDSNASPERLEQIYTMFVEVMTNKNYLVTTGEAMQSLELKYLEFLLNEENTEETREQQIYWLDKITSLVRHHGDCVIDEAHQGLSIKKRLNYIGSETQPISVDEIRNTIALFKLIDPPFIRNAPNFSPDYDWTAFKRDIAKKLLRARTSPLGQFFEGAVQKYGCEVTEELVAYLTNTAKETCLAILYACPEEKETLAFFKQEIGILLPQTLSRRLNENYGPSKRKNLSALEKTLALPYAANNIVNERCRFGNQLESINYTVQMMLIKGISHKLLIQKIEQWHAAARKEMFENAALKHLNDTPTAKGFAVLAAKLGLTLSEINLNNPMQLKKLYAYFQHNSTLIFDILQEQALRQIQREGETISSNSFNHIDLYRSVQAVSGTPSNHTTFHQRLKYNKTSSLGTDGYIIEVIHHKKTRVSGFDYTTVSQFIEGILTHSEASERTRAIIDIRPAFQGVSNFVVAQELARFYRTKANNIIKHILYFNKNQVLCALDIAKPNTPIALKTTDEKEVARLLGSTPEQRFTYYDQAHTLGTDIAQASYAHALVLADEKTSLQAFLQGSMRMRGLGVEQTIEIIVPEKIKEIQRHDLIKQFAKIDTLMLLQDNLTAAKLQMTNLMRSKCLAFIRDLPSEEAAAKRQLALIFRSFLADKPSLSFFELYGALNKPQAAADILKRHQEWLMACWHRCVELAKISAIDNELIELGLHEIIERSLPNCLAEYEAADHNAFAMEVEIQAEIQVEMEIAAIQEAYDPNLREKTLIYLYSTEKIGLDAYSLSLNARDSPEKYAGLFSENLRMSANYAKVYKGQKVCVNSFLKPALVIWYYMLEGQLHAMIVTPQEVTELIKKIKAEQFEDNWFSTTLDTVVAGKRPDAILNDKYYQSLREQVRFFNGEIHGLLNQNVSLIWLKEFTQEKLEFFQENLMPYRPRSAAAFPQLKMAVLQTSAEGFIYIAQHRFEDLSQFNWKTLFSKIIPVQFAEYCRVAKAFAYINREWNKKQLDIETVHKQFDLPLIGLGYVQEHLNQLAALHRIMNRLVQSNGTNTLLTILEQNEIKFLEDHFSMSLSEFTKKFAPAEDLNVLLLLRTYPALRNSEMGEQLIQLILQNPCCDESTINLLLESSARFSESLWRLVLEKQRTGAEAKLFAKQIFNRPEIELPEFVIDYVWNQYKDSEEQLINFATLATSEPFFDKIFTHHFANAAISSCLLKNPLFSPERFLNYFLKHNADNIEGLTAILHYLPFDLSILEQSIARAQTPETLLAFIAQDPLSSKMLLEAISNKVFSVAVAEKILEKSNNNSQVLDALLRSVLQQLAEDDSEKVSWETCFISMADYCARNDLIHVFRKTLLDIQLSKVIQFKLLTTLGNEIIEGLPFTDMVRESTDSQFEELSGLAMVYSAAHMNELVSRAQNSEQIMRLLARPEMTSSLANDLFAKSEYNHQLGDWGWLTEQQLLLVLQKTRDFDSLQRALTHPNLSKTARDNWLAISKKE